MSKSQLQKAITTVNNRYAKGLNDDDQVGRMCEIDKTTKGFSFIPKFNTYELISDFDKFMFYAEKYGYWSEAIKNFNQVLSYKGGLSYMNKINDEYRASQRPENQTKN